MGLFSKKKKTQEEVAIEKKKEPRFGPNNLITLKPVVVTEQAIFELRSSIDNDEFNKQTVNLKSKTAKNAFLQGYNYALLLLASSQDITRFNDAMVVFSSLPKENQERLNSEDDE